MIPRGLGEERLLFGGLHDAEGRCPEVSTSYWYL